MDSSNSSQSPQSRSEAELNHLPKNPDSNTPILGTPDPSTDTETTETLAEDGILSDKDPEGSIKDFDGDEGEEEEGECGFCFFMKGGGCKDSFTEWEKCVEEGERNNEDIVEKCFQATSALKKCMEAHSDYYAPLLQAEKAAEEEAAKQLEDEKERIHSEASDPSDKKETS